jgi:Ca2+-binding RTX toxin-like protein
MYDDSDLNNDTLTGGAWVDLFIINNTSDTIIDFHFGKPKAKNDGNVVMKVGVIAT